VKRDNLSEASEALLPAARQSPEEVRRAIRYAIAAELSALLAGLTAVVFAYVEAQARHPADNGLWIDLGVSVGTAFVLVGVLLRVQRAIAARLDATNAAVVAMQQHVDARLTAIDRRIADIAEQVAPRGRAETRAPVPSYPPPPPASVIIGEWAAQQSVEARRCLARLYRAIRHATDRATARLSFAGILRLGRAIPVAWRIGIGCTLCAGVILGLVFVSLTSDNREQAAHQRVYPESEQAKNYVAPSIGGSCKAAPNVAGNASTVSCRDSEGEQLVVTLTHGGPWTGIVLDEGKGGEVRARPGSCAQQPSESKVTAQKFQAATRNGEVYCFVSEGEISFMWYYGTASYVTCGNLNAPASESWGVVYARWQRDRALISGRSVPASLFD
jgi:hypothetical protein